LYDPVLGRMLSADNYVGSGTQGLNRYSYANNNPLNHVDPDGNWAHIVVGAILGGVSGWQIGEAKGAKGWDMVGYIFGGAAIGAFSGGVGSSVTASVGASVSGAYGGLIGTAVGGAVGGALGGGGFAALSKGDIAGGIWKGALSGAISSVSGGYIGGQTGAFVGGGLGGATNTLLNGGSGYDAAFSFAVSGLTSVAIYDISMNIAYEANNMKNRGISRDQFEVMSTAAQKSFVRGREYGGWLLSDGTVDMWDLGKQASVNPRYPAPRNAIGDFHTHPGIGVDSKTGLSYRERHSPEDILGYAVKRNYPDGISLFYKSIVIGRQNTYLYSPGLKGNVTANVFLPSSAFSPYRYIGLFGF
jgi:hypothetical protein